jgi:hypothetical protein
MFQTNDHHHICHLYTNKCEQVDLAVAFLNDGLAEHEACLLVCQPHAVEDWVVQLQANGIDVESQQRRRALEITAGDRQRLGGELHSIVKANEVLAFIRTRMDFPGVRILADCGWGFDPPLPDDLLCHWEATLDLALHDLNVRAVCQYDKQSNSPAAIYSALRTHRVVVLGEQIYRSPCFEAPNILANEPWLNDASADAEQVQLMLRQLDPCAVLAS